MAPQPLNEVAVVAGVAAVAGVTGVAVVAGVEAAAGVAVVGLSVGSVGLSARLLQCNTTMG